MTTFAPEPNPSPAELLEARRRAADLGDTAAVAEFDAQLRAVHHPELETTAAARLPETTDAPRAAGWRNR